MNAAGLTIWPQICMRARARADERGKAGRGGCGGKSERWGYIQKGCCAIACVLAWRRYSYDLCLDAHQHPALHPVPAQTEPL